MRNLAHRFILITLIAVPIGAAAQNGGPPPKPVEVVNAPTVDVGNTQANPVPVRDVDRSERVPFQASCSGSDDCSIDIPGTGVLRIEHVTMQIVVDDPSVPLQVLIRVPLNGELVSHELIPTRLGATPADFGVYVVSQPVRLYADAFGIGPGTNLSGDVNSFSGITSTDFRMTVSGLLEN